VAHPPHTPTKGRDKAQLIAFLLTLLLVIVGAFAVVLFPTQLGLPGLHPATPVAATPAAATPAP